MGAGATRQVAGGSRLFSTPQPGQKTQFTEVLRHTAERHTARDKLETSPPQDATAAERDAAKLEAERSAKARADKHPAPSTTTAARRRGERPRQSAGQQPSLTSATLKLDFKFFDPDKRPDGSQVIELADGSRVIKLPDGREVRLMPQDQPWNLSSSTAADGAPQTPLTLGALEYAAEIYHKWVKQKLQGTTDKTPLNTSEPVDPSDWMSRLSPLRTIAAAPLVPEASTCNSSPMNLEALRTALDAQKTLDKLETLKKEFAEKKKKKGDVKATAAAGIAWLRGGEEAFAPLAQSDKKELAEISNSNSEIENFWVPAARGTLDGVTTYGPMLIPGGAGLRPVLWSLGFFTLLKTGGEEAEKYAEGQDLTMGSVATAFAQNAGHVTYDYVTGRVIPGVSKLPLGYRVAAGAALSTINGTGHRIINGEEPFGFQQNTFEIVVGGVTAKYLPLVQSMPWAIRWTAGAGFGSTVGVAGQAVGNWRNDRPPFENSGRAAIEGGFKGWVAGIMLPKSPSRGRTGNDRPAGLMPLPRRVENEGTDTKGLAPGKEPKGLPSGKDQKRLPPVPAEEQQKPGEWSHDPPWFRSDTKTWRLWEKTGFNGSGIYTTLEGVKLDVRVYSSEAHRSHALLANKLFEEVTTGISDTRLPTRPGDPLDTYRPDTSPRTFSAAYPVRMDGKPAIAKETRGQRVAELGGNEKKDAIYYMNQMADVFNWLGIEMSMDDFRYDSDGRNNSNMVYSDSSGALGYNVQGDRTTFGPDVGAMELSSDYYASVNEGIKRLFYRISDLKIEELVGTHLPGNNALADTLIARRYNIIDDFYSKKIKMFQKRNCPEFDKYSYMMRGTGEPLTPAEEVAINTVVSGKVKYSDLTPEWKVELRDATHKLPGFAGVTYRRVQFPPGGETEVGEGASIPTGFDLTQKDLRRVNAEYRNGDCLFVISGFSGVSLDNVRVNPPTEGQVLYRDDTRLRCVGVDDDPVYRKIFYWVEEHPQYKR
jgi:hypothetical protein